MSRVVIRSGQRMVLVLLPIALVLALPTLALATAPGVVTGAASSITGGSATLNGTVNPEDQSNTSYQFDYDDARDLFCTSGGTMGQPALPTSPTTLSFSDNAPHAVSAPTVSGFSPGESLCFRVEATNGGETSYGTAVTFATTAMALSTGPASSVSNDGATFNGTINSEGESISYDFRYGSCTSSSTSWFSSPTTSLGPSDGAVHAVIAAVNGLAPSRSYCDQNGKTVTKRQTIKLTG
jgi:hypothetical protein